ncbi:GntR family transcriptional regulator [Herbihabitans rhizosphaerae]|uniref:GntR family transcriptional regulator n=1 Tax=Herbihabitans rhizosphaerae TaxID=1872711 RepID=A0A4Q7KKZ0_9PSEU|nr:GntR family transcriptional regulator [Herbihabitans rhizosphaerae]RZS37165.1 GntR family transcriptional regulator [Herbihabitans rhizosphaerae]
MNSADPRPLHDQVAAALRGAIASGEAPDRLPPAKEIAEMLGINVNTVLRALRELRDEGLLEFRRGRGISVNTAARGGRGEIVERLHDLVRLAEKYGVSRTEIIELIGAMR